MSASAATRLRQLATQYHGGELDLGTYRRLRADLLDRLTQAEPDHDEASTTLPQRTRPAATAAAPKPRAAPPPAAPAPVPAANAPRKGSGGVFLIIGVIAAVAIGAAWLLLRPAPTPSAEVAEQVDTTSESYLAIEDFLAADDWSDEQIANFNTRWATMPDDMRVAALDQPWYQNFVERVRARVKERRALTATADRAGNVEGPLAALASTVGIDISSPDTKIPVRRPALVADESASLAPAGSVKPAAAPVAVPAAAVTRAPAAAPKPAAVAAHPPAAAAAVAVTAAAAAPDTNPDRCRAELAGSRKPRCRDVLSDGGFGPFLVMIRAGEFEMGNKDFAQEGPAHHVTITKPFAIAEFEASQEEFREFCTRNKRSCEAQPWQGDDYPVVRVSWQDARDYAAWLSSASGKTYRLATEAEWEFAARAGGNALYPSGEALSQTDAVYTVNEKLAAPWPRSHKINANASRLFHSIGNVREWVEDPWSASYVGAPGDGSARKSGDSTLRVVRGGAYADTAPKLRFTTREGIDASTRDTVTGFRVVREL